MKGCSLLGAKTIRILYSRVSIIIIIINGTKSKLQRARTHYAHISLSLYLTHSKTVYFLFSIFSSPSLSLLLRFGFGFAFAFSSSSSSNTCPPPFLQLGLRSFLLLIRQTLRVVVRSHWKLRVLWNFHIRRRLDFLQNFSDGGVELLVGAVEGFDG